MERGWDPLGVVVGLAALGASGLAIAWIAGPETRFGWQALAAGTTSFGLALLAWWILPARLPERPEEERFAPLLERHVCPQCLHPERPWRSICRRCGTPSGGLASSLPFESKLLWGWALGAACPLKRPTGLQCLGGMGICAPKLASAGLGLGWGVWVTGFPGPWATRLLLMTAYAVWSALMAWAFFRLPLRWLAARREARDPGPPADPPTAP